MFIHPPKCVVCQDVAITTVVHIPVCKKHYDAYADEARQGRPEHERPILKMILELGEK